MKTNPYIEFLVEESRWFDEYEKRVMLPMLQAAQKKIDKEWGMTDRDTFAAAALTGLLACMKDESCAEICESAYGWADAMLAVRDSRTADTPPLHATPPQGNATGKWNEPVAWACFGPGYTHIAQHRELVEDSARVEGGYIAPLYRHPQPTLTDEEREAVEAAIIGGCEMAATLRKLLERLK